MDTIRWIFEQINVPQWWYSFEDPRENTLCFLLDGDGIHTFVLERGEKKSERIFHNWYDAITDAAQSFEPQYTNAVIDASDMVRKGDVMPDYSSYVTDPMKQYQHQQLATTMTRVRRKRMKMRAEAPARKRQERVRA